MKLDKTKIYERHYEDSVSIPAGVAEVFTFIDDHTRLSSHMNKPSWMMGGGRMETSFDAGHGQEVGSHIRMNGKVFGIALSLDEVVTRREPPRVKIWETVGMSKLLIIDHYCMKVELEPQKDGTLLRVSIDYNLPAKNVWLGKLFSGYYARWCVQQMIKDARSYSATHQLKEFAAKEQKQLYQCKECGFYYGDNEWAEKCEAWCKKHKSCNLEITKYAIDK